MGVIYQQTTPKNKDTQKLQAMASGTDEVLLEISSVFPFQLFPDTVILDKNKVSIVHRALLFKRIFPLLYTDIQTVRVNKSILFSALEFEVRGYDRNPRPVTHLDPLEAEKAERYILGLVNAKRERVDLSRVDGIKKTLAKLGNTNESFTNGF